MSERKVIFTYKAANTIEQECRKTGLSRGWSWDDEDTIQDLRESLKDKGIYLFSSKEGLFKPFQFEVVEGGPVDSVVYYYLTLSPYLSSIFKDEMRKTPVKYGCVCMTYHKEDGTVSKGYSYCSFADNFCKKKGRGLAYQRLMQTLKVKNDMYVGNYLGEREDFALMPATYKGEYHTVPTYEELHTLGVYRCGKPLEKSR